MRNLSLTLQEERIDDALPLSASTGITTPVRFRMQVIPHE